MRLLLALLIATVSGVVGWLLCATYGNTDPGNASMPEAIAIERATNQVKGLGKLEPAGGIIKILAPQGQKIDSLFDLKVGDSVNRDQPLVQIAGRKARELELNIAQAKKRDAFNQLEMEQSRGILKRDAAEIAVEQAQSMQQKVQNKSKQIELLRSQKTAALEQMQRLKNLDTNPLTANMVGQSDLIKQQLMVDQIQTRIDDAELESQHGLEQARRAEKAAEVDLKTVDQMLQDGKKSVPIETLNAAIEAAQTALDMTQIKSPIDGTVLDIAVFPGDSVTNKPVMVIGDTTKMVCVTEVNDVNFRHVNVGDKATIKSNAMKEDLTGNVVSKGIMIGPPSMKDPNPFASVDRKTGKVVIEIDDVAAASQFINLQVDVVIETGNDTDVAN